MISTFNLIHWYNILMYDAIEIYNNKTLKWSYSYHPNTIPMANCSLKGCCECINGYKMLKCVGKFGWILVFPFPIHKPHPTF
jgi:hypothetical protein